MRTLNIYHSRLPRRYTFEVGPAFTLVEHKVIEHVLAKVGFPSGDGIFTPGRWPPEVAGQC